MSRLSTEVSGSLPRRGIKQGTSQGSRDPEGTSKISRPNEGMQKALFVVGIVLCALLLPLLIFNLTLAFKAVIQPEKAPSIFGYTPLVVLTDSMYPTITSGSLVIAQNLSPHDDLVVGDDGDVVSFYSGSSVVTHRVVAKMRSEIGEELYVTKGDLNPVPDMNAVALDEVIGPVAFTIPSLGNAILFFQGPLGMLSVVAVLLLMGGAVLLIRSRRTQEGEGGLIPDESQGDVLAGDAHHDRNTKEIL